MDNAWDNLRSAICQARELDRAVGSHASTMANLLRGKLHHCHSSDLAALKRELKNYNMHTGKWKNKP